MAMADSGGLPLSCQAPTFASSCTPGSRPKTLATAQQLMTWHEHAWHQQHSGTRGAVLEGRPSVLGHTGHGHWCNRHPTK
jgi:hypothetical protein